MSIVIPPASGVSPLAKLEAHPRHVGDRAATIWGVTLHCTGSGVVNRALANGRDPFREAVNYYLRPDTPFTPHYVIGFDGQIAQVANEHERCQHVGFPAQDRQSYLTGAWKYLLPSGYVAAWQKRWPGYISPAHLFPGSSPNEVYCGVELVVWQQGCAGEPMRPGLKYTEKQHRAAAALAEDVARRWNFPRAWSRSGRLVAHEDLNPIERVTAGQGWDPGVARSDPWCDWSFILSLLERPLVS